MKNMIRFLPIFACLVSFGVKAINEIDFRFSTENVIEASIGKEITYLQLDIETTDRFYKLSYNNYGKQVHIYIDGQLEEMFTIVVGIESGVLRITSPSESLNRKLRSLTKSVN